MNHQFEYYSVWQQAEWVSELPSRSQMPVVVLLNHIALSKLPQRKSTHRTAEIGGGRHTDRSGFPCCLFIVIVVVIIMIRGTRVLSIIVFVVQWYFDDQRADVIRWKPVPFIHFPSAVLQGINILGGVFGNNCPPTTRSAQLVIKCRNGWGVEMLMRDSGRTCNDRCLCSSQVTSVHWTTNKTGVVCAFNDTWWLWLNVCLSVLPHPLLNPTGSDSAAT